jgi:hypothetical protein
MRGQPLTAWVSWVGRWLARRAAPAIDVLSAPFVVSAAALLKGVRSFGVQRLPLCRSVLIWLGVFPVRRHYYEPQFDFRASGQVVTARSLPGLSLDVSRQLNLLSQLRFRDEVATFSDEPAKRVPQHSGRAPKFTLHNPYFTYGDAEIWYQMIRHRKPHRIYEIGGGYSTLLAAQALRVNMREDPSYAPLHVCIEPYEAPWLEAAGPIVLREPVERVSAVFFEQLGPGDLVFIDSSHVIRPEGDVVWEYLELLPRLRPGVCVHIHDIFTPRNYLQQWLRKEVRFWNEQYLLEAFLTQNPRWRVLLSVNHLHHTHPDALRTVAPSLLPTHEPASFYIERL